MKVVHFTSHKQCASFAGNYFCKRYANILGAESGHALRMNRNRITKEQELAEFTCDDDC